MIPRATTTRASVAATDPDGPALRPLSVALAATCEQRVVVLHAESGRGFALTVDGVSTMRELAVLLGGDPSLRLAESIFSRVATATDPSVIDGLPSQTDLSLREIPCVSSEGS